MAQPTAAIGSVEAAGVRRWIALAIALLATVIAVLGHTSGAPGTPFGLRRAR